MAVKNRIAAGYEFTFYGVNDQNGYFHGNTVAGVVAGNADGQVMLRLETGRTVPLAIPEPEKVTPTGDNHPIVTFQFPSADLPSGILETAARNAEFEALCQGTKTLEIGNLRIGALNPSGTDAADMCLLLMRQAKTWTPGSRGVSKWEAEFVNSCQITPLFADITERQHSPYRYSVTLSNSDRAVWGATWTTGEVGTEEMSQTPVDSDYPLMVQVWKGNAARTAFNLAYTPETSGTAVIFVNGVQQTVTTDYTITGKTLTFVSPPASGAYIHALYEVVESEL